MAGPAAKKAQNAAPSSSTTTVRSQDEYRWFAIVTRNSLVDNDGGHRHKLRLSLLRQVVVCFSDEVPPLIRPGDNLITELGSCDETALYREI